jgi:hypothetical protein
MSKENRQSLRYPFCAFSTINIRSNGNVNRVSAIANNLSESGARLRSYLPLKKGSNVSVDLSFINKGGREENDTFEGKVVWMSRKGEIFYTGVVFKERLHPEKQSNLYKHFNEFIKWELIEV